MWLRIGRTATEQLSELESDDLWFEAWNELRRLQRGTVDLQCTVGEFANHWCASGAVGFRVSRPTEDLVLVWHLIP